MYFRDCHAALLFVSDEGGTTPVQDELPEPEDEVGWPNTLRPRRNGRHFADDIFKCIIFFNENLHILIQFPLEFVGKVPLNQLICYISGKNDLIAMKWKANILYLYID